MLLNSDIIIGAFTAALTVLVYFVTRDLSRLGSIFINAVLIAMGVLSLVVFVKGLIKPERLKFFESAVERNNILTGVVILMIYLIFLPLVGFLPSSYCFYFAFNLYLGEDRFALKNIFTSALLTFLVVTVFYIVFHYFLEVPLPAGAWFE
ncbi:MAG: tripartite tricarboxylate transporter TctB family protein [Deltaproteobacteria bacterium]|nr:tripartite tricarboxylate transporter TctB family protein [Deltaproteobacteria bacterium]MBW1955339.1 tripartite tricarboxylate transporter TctB family protein [Deltaproteobacteria bacterium]MBW2041995.1 tripartite tricarboxylate transporter TctB family protein [Deltaproteobacteria bacterium]MBW2132361.1 tripartite tricarboxylate transporter TctB family protein [Deltaproteobacteria bacterium]